MWAGVANNVIGFLDLVRESCKQHNVTFRMSPGRRGKSAGFFDSTKRVLWVASDEDDQWYTLAHEFGHLQGWLEGLSWYNDGPEDEDALFEKWLSGGVELPDAEVTRLCRSIQGCELDAERRALRYARSWGLVKDIKAAVREANGNVWRYEVARLTRRWPTWNDDDVTATLPARLLSPKAFGKPPLTMMPGA